MNEDESDFITLAKAIEAAREAFDNVFDKAGLDAAYWSLDLKVKCMSDDFMSVLRVIIDKDKSKDCSDEKKEA
jgi:hypothetical protein